MGLEVDFLPVGEATKSGDAIGLRFGNLLGKREEQFVAIIDGGTKQSGTELVNLINSFYKTDTVDLVINTHPDSDHSSGLTEVLMNLNVKEFWMHQPWLHSAEYNDLFKDGRITENSLKRTLQESLNYAYSLEEIAKKKKIPIYEPFSDVQQRNPYFTVLGPSTTYYETMLANFRGTPEPSKAAQLASAILEKFEKTLTTIRENWVTETLTDPDDNATAAENNSSVILYLKYLDSTCLFTGDAGVGALKQAKHTALQRGISLNNVSLFQIPHHGSRRNIGPTLLNGIIGNKLDTEPLEKLKTVIISATKDSVKHPSKRVTNACKRRGAKVVVTSGITICHNVGDIPNRNWQPASEVEFHSSWDEEQ
jgi:beta-lactamase superfamily II metal-dependent hydrolase